MYVLSNTTYFVNINNQVNILKYFNISFNYKNTQSIYNLK